MSIAQKRKDNGLTQMQLASSINVSPAAVAMWETNERTPRLENLLAMAKLFNCTVDELIAAESEDI